MSLKAGSSASLLTQKLMGSLATASPGNTSSVRNDVSVTKNDAIFDYHPQPPSNSNNNNYVVSNDYSMPVGPSATQPTAYFQQYDQSRFQHPAFDNGAVLVAAPPTKPKPKRRRKPQKPGLTAKNQERHFVHHNYHDHANDPDEEEVDDANHRRRGGVAVSFPLKLHSVLEQVEVDGFSHVISWQPHGRCFVIHKPKEFTDVVMPRYFRQTKLTSFQRQLNLYGFQRLTRGNDSGGYYHELFLRGRANLCKRMVRTKVKGTKFKAASSPEEEPNFYNMPPVIVTPHSSDCDNSEDGHSAGRSYHDSFNGSTVSHHNFNEGRGDYRAPSYTFDSYQGSTAAAQPQEAPVSPMVNKFAMQTFGTLPPPMGGMSSTSRLASQFAPTSPIPANNARSAVDFSAIPSIQPSGSGDFLDQAVDELFLEDSQAVNEVMEFVNVWDAEEGINMGEVTNDIQLGNLLDRLLDD